MHEVIMYRIGFATPGLLPWAAFLSSAFRILKFKFICIDAEEKQLNRTYIRRHPRFIEAHRWCTCQTHTCHMTSHMRCSPSIRVHKLCSTKLCGGTFYKFCYVHMTYVLCTLYIIQLLYYYSEKFRSPIQVNIFPL